MSTPISRNNFAKDLWPGVNTWYGDTYNDWQTEHDKLFDFNVSTKAYEEDVGIVGLGYAQKKPEGASVSFDSMKQGFVSRYTHVEWALGFMVTRNAYEDDQYGVIARQRSRALARSMRLTKEVNAANVYNRGFNSAYTGGDGVELFSALHLNKSGSTWSNTASVASDISEASLEQACIDIAGWTDDRGLPIAANAMSLHIAKEEEFNVLRILKTVGRVGTADNDLNALNSMGKFPKGVFVNHYFDDPDAWFIRTDVPDGMKYFERRADDFTMDNDFPTENAMYKSTGRYSHGWTDARGVYGVPGA